MDYSKRSDTLFIDEEALSTLAIVQEGLLYPVTKLMGKREADEVDRTKRYKGLPMPFSFILSPEGKRNQQNIKKFKQGDKITLICNNKEVGYVVVDEIFEIDINRRLKNIYGSDDLTIPVINRAYKRIGKLAISGEYRVDYPPIRESIRVVKEKITETNAKSVTGMVLGANPLTRAQERVVREVISESDLMIIFLIKPFINEGLSYKIRKKSVDILIENFLPRNKVLVVPLENSYIFAGYNELILDAILAKNYGCNRLVIGKNHRALGILYSQDQINTVFDTFKDLDIEIVLKDEYVYCDVCKTLVNSNTCPHGQHHHIHYHHKPLMELITSGILPPPILVRKEISAHIIASLFPNRLKNLQETYDMLMPNNGLLENKSEEEFYVQLMKLYQTSSLT